MTITSKKRLTFGQENFIGGLIHQGRTSGELLQYRCRMEETDDGFKGIIEEARYDDNGVKWVRGKAFTVTL